ncbi:hypothetical protein ACOMHN_050722 [Nucella lapillus]
MRAVCLYWCCLFVTWISLSAGVMLTPCGGAGYQEVEENTTLIFTCDQYSGSVSWVFKAVTGSTTSIGTCSLPCTSNIPVFTLTANSATSSSLTTSRTARDSSQSGAEYQCVANSVTKKCGLHVIVPAVVSQPTPVVNRQDSGYTLPVSAAVTKVYSSRGLYSCAVQLGSSSQPGTIVLSPTANDTSNTADRSGRCDVTMPIPVTSGTYSCSVTVNPGNTHTSCGNFTITPPSPPTINCTSDFIPENSPPTCTCNANNIGQPGGRLRWYTGTGSSFSTEVGSANYDVTTLEMTQSVTRGDNGTKFRCVNNWMVKVNAASDYTASVAWGPDSVSIDGNTPFYTDTKGSHTMTLTCQVNGVNPSSALTYNWNVLCDDKQQITCTFRPRPGPNGDDNRVTTCTATNSKNNNKQRQNSVTLDIKYPPLSAPQISGYVNGHVLTEGDNLTLTCAVIGGDPQVTSVTLTCPGRSKQKTTNGQSSSLDFFPLSSSDHNLTCVCSGQWAMQGYYNLTDSRTLTVYCEMRIVRDSFSSAEDGVPVLDSSSQHGELHFQVLTTDTPHTATFLYLGTNFTGAGYPPTSGLLSVTFAQTSMAYKSRCVLTASNVTQQWIGYYNVTIATAAQTVSFTFRLKMKNEMRIAKDSFSSSEDGVPVLDSSPQQGELHFQVLTTDTPHTATFLYLGTDSAGAWYPPTSGLLR